MKNEFQTDESHIAYRLLSELDDIADGTDILGPVMAMIKYHSTPLYLAVIRKHPEVAKYLIQQGADTNLRG